MISETHLYEARTQKPGMLSSGLWLEPQKWLSIATSIRSLTKKQVRSIRFTAIHHGVPDGVRGRIWVKLLDIDSVRSQHANNMYRKLCDFPNEKDHVAIVKDVDRTMFELDLW